MPPLEPGQDHPADRDQRPGADRDNDERSRLTLGPGPHKEIIQPLIECHECLMVMHQLLLKALKAQIEVDGSVLLT